MIPTRQGARRGRTRRDRLARLDAFLVATESRLLARRDGRFADAIAVDLGPGDDPGSSLALAHIARPLVVVDHDPVRVAAAAAVGLDAREGGFDLPVSEPVRLVRAMNVLRGYRPHEVADAHARLGVSLLPGGLLVEGSCDHDGGVLVASLLRRTEDGLVREGVLFSTDFSRGFAPKLFRDWLPRDLRGQPPEVRDLLARWTAAFHAVRAEGLREPPVAFAASAERVVDLDATRADAGDVVWRPG